MVRASDLRDVPWLTRGYRDDLGRERERKGCGKPKRSFLLDLSSGRRTEGVRSATKSASSTPLSIWGFGKALGRMGDAIWMRISGHPLPSSRRYGAGMPDAPLAMEAAWSAPKREGKEEGREAKLRKEMWSGMGQARQSTASGLACANDPSPEKVKTANEDAKQKRKQQFNSGNITRM